MKLSNLIFLTAIGVIFVIICLCVIFVPFDSCFIEVTCTYENPCLLIITIQDIEYIHGFWQNSMIITTTNGYTYIFSPYQNGLQINGIYKIEYYTYAIGETYYIKNIIRME